MLSLDVSNGIVEAVTYSISQYTIEVWKAVRFFHSTTRRCHHIFTSPVYSSKETQWFSFFDTTRMKLKELVSAHVI